MEDVSRSSMINMIKNFPYEQFFLRVKMPENWQRLRLKMQGKKICRIEQSYGELVDHNIEWVDLIANKFG